VEILLFVDKVVVIGKNVRSGLAPKEGSWVSWLEDNPWRKLLGEV
jgi:hypothetical protein